MKKKIIVLLGVISAFFCNAQTQEEKAWNDIYKNIEKSIKAPVFKNKIYKITDFGAKADNAEFLNHNAINSAIKKCSDEGGGIVLVPAGTWFCGPITLLKNVNLKIDKGATLKFSADASLYPLVKTRWEGMDCYNYQPLIYSYKQDNIAITGKGTIDGNASNDRWWNMNGSLHYGWKEGIVSQKIGRPILANWNNEGVSVEKRKMGDGFGMRPQLVNLYHCNNILIEEVSMIHSPFWTLHPLLCNNVTVRKVKFINDGPNGDGCDPESCNNVLIEDCYFDTGDDCIAIKSGRNRDGLTANVPSQNMIVRNSTMKNGHGGVVVGSEISGGYKNLFVENCTMDSPELERAIRIKTNSARGGVIDGIYVRNVKVGECKEAVLRINLNYESSEPRPVEVFPIVKNVFLQNVTSNKSKFGVFIDGYDDKTNVSNIKLLNCKFDNVQQDIKVLGKVDGLQLQNVTIGGKKMKDGLQ